MDVKLLIIGLLLVVIALLWIVVISDRLIVLPDRFCQEKGYDNGKVTNNDVILCWTDDLERLEIFANE